MAQRLLMCPPAHYEIPYALNPWMSGHVGYRAPDAQRQWDRLVETLHVAADVDIKLVDPTPAMPGLVFTASAALVSGELAILSSFRHQEQRREQGIFRGALAQLGFATTFLQQTYFEGSGDALFDRVRPIVYAGYGWRSERTATLQLSTMLNARVLPLLLVDERFYHLDMALCPLRSGHVIAYMDAFREHAQRALRRNVDPGYLIEISVEDALQLACNAIELDDALVLHAASRPLRDRLVHAGYRVFATELSEFMKSGAGAKKLTLRLDDGPVAPEVAA
jgi:N-dimethylarginine dimethylaminohydrolase